jgi:hypothetical protein
MAVHQILAAVVKGVAGEGAGQLAQSLTDHFQNHGDILEKALIECHDGAWTVLKTALSGPGLWGRLRMGGSQTALVEQIQAFVAQHPIGRDPEHRKLLLAELRTAERQGLLRPSTTGGAGLTHTLAETLRQPALPTNPLADLDPDCRELAEVVSTPLPPTDQPLSVRAKAAAGREAQGDGRLSQRRAARADPDGRL